MKSLNVLSLCDGMSCGHIELQSVIKDGYAPINKARCLTVMDSHGYYNGCN